MDLLGCRSVPCQLLKSSDEVFGTVNSCPFRRSTAYFSAKQELTRHAPNRSSNRLRRRFDGRVCFGYPYPRIALRMLASEAYQL